MRRPTLLVLVLAACLFGWRLGQPGFSDTEGMFAEPGREMVATGDWITPRINGEPFFTKPPLMYWLPATVFAAFGPTELARMWPAAAGVATVAATIALGSELLGGTAGLAAGLVLTTSAGFFMEARMLRADMILVLTVTLALYLYVRLRRGAQVATAMSFWVTLAVGVLDKGFLAIVLPGATIALAEWLDGVLRPRTLGERLRALRVPSGVMMLLAIAAPWHAIAAVRNPGFLWDYVVNQHVLVFFDAKLPRDSIPDSLGFFWTMVLVRGLPWSLLLPAAVLQAWKSRRDDAAHMMAFRLIAGWLAVVLGFFSLAASRLEHYSLPAMPSTALLIGGLCADALRGRLRVRRAWLLVPVATAGCVAAGLLFVDPRQFLEALEPSLVGFALEHLVSLAGVVLGVGLLATATLGFLARDRAAFVLGMGTAVAALTLVQVAHERVEVLFSWRPFARLVAERGPEHARIFFRASDEYQLCGGLEYYLARRLDLLAPPGWVPPTFLEGRTERLFTDREEFDRVWRESPSFFVSDDVDPPGSETALVPGPHNLIVRAGTRVLLQSRKIVAASCHPGKGADVVPSG